MSELNQKIQKYISRSGITIYQMAKYTGLDRTMIQKMVKGSKYPGVKFFLRFCDALMLNSGEREELINLFQVEKIGLERFEKRRAVGQLIDSLQSIPDDYNSFLSAQISGVRFRGFSGRSEKLVGRHEIIAHGWRMLHEQVSGYQSSSVYTDMSGVAEILLQEMVPLMKEYHHRVEIYHQLLVSWQDPPGNESAVNISKLTTILHMMFLMGEDYHVSYSYINNPAEEYRHSPFRHYLLTEDRLLLFNDKEDTGVVVSDPVFLAAYRDEVRRIESASQRLGLFYSDPAEALAVRRKLWKECPVQAVYETSVCTSLIAGSSAVDPIRGSALIRDYLAACEEIEAYSDREDVIRIFGMGGMEELIRTGKGPRLFGEPPEVFSPDERRLLVNAYAKALEDSRNVWMLRDPVCYRSPAVKIELLAPNRVVLSLHGDDTTRFMCVILQESSIFESILDYFRSMTEYEKVYPEEEGASEFRRAMNGFLSKL